MNALAKLEQAINFGVEEIGRLRVGGFVSEVTPSHYRISGLSQFLKLGECVGLRHGGATHLGEVVRIDSSGTTVKSFEAKVTAGLGDPAYRIGPLHLFPDASLEGPGDRCARARDRWWGPLAAGRASAFDRGSAAVGACIGPASKNR